MNERLERLKKSKNYYGLLLELDHTDDRIEYYLDQIEERGFDNTELWSLDIPFVKFMIPRLIAYKEIVVPNLNFEDKDAFLKELNYIIKYFEIRAEDKEYNWDLKIQKKVYKAYKMFADIIPSLWC